MNIALVHDYLADIGGAEKVLLVLNEMFPKAPIFTLFYDVSKCGSIFPKEKIITSPLQKLPAFILKRRKYLFPLMPSCIETFDFKGFDLVISSSSVYSHAVITPANTKHICYCHSPMRFAWDWCHEYLKEQRMGILKEIIAEAYLHKIRIWDKSSSDRPDLYIANSENVQKRISKYYRLPSIVVYPPVETQRFKVQKSHEDYFLIVSRLSAYKKINLAVELFNKIQRKLIIIGEGSELNHLKSISGKTIDFLGFVDDKTVAEYMKNCRAFLFPGEEDFGITAVEAMACGKPVLAYYKGGLKEILIEGQNGEFFQEPTIESMEDGLARLLQNEKSYNPKLIRKSAEKFSKDRFIEEMKKIVNQQMGI